ncbi:MAG: DUF4197 domain-containing protein [Trichlorobacter sp.]|uniref:DUF4197 domain-containing protein n=1 Tax=Trichlorobacter sp. TaxID=2911007 RepID=UPI002561A91A|nr:DUF4197 domain-containing protein [Trichlorobacter sp.]MDK9717696.1 DUF4197 domain-containing protein [Trichlorobacter sp.]
MKPLSCCIAIAIFLLQSPCQAGFLDSLSQEILPPSQQRSSLDTNVIVKGLKEALATGTEKAVTAVSKPDGYFRNQLIKILLPAKIQQVADVAARIGFQQQVDTFVLSMNRAAEKAAPQAARYFGNAIRQMTVEDAKQILNGGDTAATTFFEKKTRAQLFEAFKPSVTTAMNQAGTARAYKELIGKYEATPLAAFSGKPSLDLDEYVTNKALDGLFLMVAEEEKKIRKDPAARTTDLLRKVFGGK